MFDTLVPKIFHVATIGLGGRKTLNVGKKQQSNYFDLRNPTNIHYNSGTLFENSVKKHADIDKVLLNSIVFLK